MKTILHQIVDKSRLAQIDLFDQLQLNNVLQICRESKNLSNAGRKLYHVSRLTKKVINDADRLKKYLDRFGISWSDIID